MLTLLPRFRGPLVGLTALALSAGVALAAAPSAPGATGLANAASHAGKTVPVQAGGQSGDQAEANDTEGPTDTTDSSSSDHCNVDLAQAASVLAGLNHGSVVCSAAQGNPPGGFSATTFANHGAWVSSFARGDHGSNQSATGQSHRPSSSH